MLILGEGFTLASGETIGNIDFEGFKIGNLSLESQYFSVKNFKLQEKVENKKFVNPFSDGYSPISYYLRGGKITFDLTIRGDTPKSLMEQIDYLRDEVFEKNQTLYFEINGIKRKVIVNCVGNPLIFNNYNVTFLKTSLSFEYDDFVLDMTTSDIVLPGQTANFIMNLDNDGTQRTELDIIYVFGTGTNLTGLEIVEVDGNNIFSITDTFVEGDVLNINHTKKTVLKNGQRIDFNGEFLWLENEGARFDFNFTGVVNCDVFILNAIKYR